MVDGQLYFPAGMIKACCCYTPAMTKCFLSGPYGAPFSKSDFSCKRWSSKVEENEGFWLAKHPLINSFIVVAKTCMSSMN